MRAIANRFGPWWAVEVPEVPGAYTQARSLDAARSMAVDAVALLLEVDATSVQVEVEPVLGRQIDDMIARSKELQRDAERARDEAAAASRGAVREMLDRGLSQKDVATILGVSFQRVHQLAH